MPATPTKTTWTCRTNSSYAAARNRGTIVTVSHEGPRKFVCTATEWSRFEGEGGRVTVAIFANLRDARSWAEEQCETRPSFGDVEWT